MEINNVIETKAVTIQFNSLVAVNKVDFTMKEGEAVGIIGSNGAGKTTFFNLLTGMFHPTEGSIFYNGVDITNVPPHRRVMMGMARTFQLVSVFDSLTVIDNLILSVERFRKNQGSKLAFFFSEAHRPSIREICEEALVTMGIEEKRHLMTSELSYGDKRKLEIAVALSLKPKILLLDEPFAGLGDLEIGEVSTIIRKVKENFSFIIIEHKISRIVDLVQRLSVMHEGKMIAEGVPAEVLSNPLVREVYWGKEEGLACSV
jgi:branched-chain amino acid transport system ATP-binding protein